jgi:hypothetical protein
MCAQQLGVDAKPVHNNLHEIIDFHANLYYIAGLQDQCRSHGWVPRHVVVWILDDLILLDEPESL